MTADAQHRSPEAPPSSPTAPVGGEPPWAAPFAAQTAHDDGPVTRRPHRVTALVAAAALAVGLLGGVGIGRVTAPAAQRNGTSVGGFPQGGPGGTGFPGGARGLGGPQSGTGVQGAPADPGAAAAPGQGGQLDRGGSSDAQPQGSTT